ncbi:MAG TPA: hypothetical protein VEB19_14355 [Gemmatimonadaceae bacterium]|nr:hypothetical protein [Gemmatimonadaceae bacterium]
MKTRSSLLYLPGLLLLAGTALGAQQAAPPPPDTTLIPKVGDMAPDFAFRPITRDGIAAKPAKLSDYRDQTVVLWFFARARTRG